MVEEIPILHSYFLFEVVDKVNYWELEVGVGYKVETGKDIQ